MRLKHNQCVIDGRVCLCERVSKCESSESVISRSKCEINYHNLAVTEVIESDSLGPKCVYTETISLHSAQRFLRIKEIIAQQTLPAPAGDINCTYVKVRR